MTELIVGPCSFETFEDTEATVKFLTRLGIKYIRGGALKYRSNPNDYQGKSEVYDWIAKLKEEYNFKFVNEIFTNDAEYGLNNDNAEFFADILQIGSRNMHNTQLLKSINETENDKPVILKRHYAAGLNEFLNHAAYIEGTEVILCFRGIMGLWPQEQRFHPDVTDIARLRHLMEERGLFDEHIDALKVADIKYKYKICYDVSHSACDSMYVKDIIKCAMVYKPDYLMIEVHPNPTRALSDAKQQIDFATFEKWHKEGLFNA